MTTAQGAARKTLARRAVLLSAGRGPVEIDVTGVSHGWRVLLARLPILRSTHDQGALDATPRRTAGCARRSATSVSH
jgi:hypothetical protein